MLRKQIIIQSLKLCFLIVCAAGSGWAQKTTVDKNPLAGFEKSIVDGSSDAIERDLLNYVIRNQNDAKGFELLARMRFNQNRLGEARALYQKALLLDPNLSAAKINLAVINFRTGNSATALSALDEIPDAELAGDPVRLQLAQAFALGGDCQKALAAVEKLGFKVKNADALPLRARCYIKTKENAKIDPLIAAAGTLARQNPAVSLEFAGVLIDGEMFREAAGILRAVVRAYPQNADALISLAKAEIYLKDFGNAKIHLDQASKIKDQSPAWLFVQSLFESEQGNAAGSLELLEKALAAEPNSPAVLRQFVISAIRANENGKAVRAAEKLRQLAPDDPDFLYLYGAATLQNNSLKAAEDSLTKYFELRPQDPRGCVALGLVYASQADKLDVARGQMRKCIELDSNNYEAKYQLGLSYKTQGETAQAIEYLEATVKDAPGHAAALRDLGAVYLLAGSEAKARIVLEKSVAIDPNDSDTHFQLSRLYNLIGETELAKKHFEIFQKLKTPKKDGM